MYVSYRALCIVIPIVYHPSPTKYIMDIFIPSKSTSVHFISAAVHAAHLQVWQSCSRQKCVFNFTRKIGMWEGLWKQETSSSSTTSLFHSLNIGEIRHSSFKWINLLSSAAFRGILCSRELCAGLGQLVEAFFPRSPDVLDEQSGWGESSGDTERRNQDQTEAEGGVITAAALSDADGEDVDLEAQLVADVDLVKPWVLCRDVDQ